MASHSAFISKVAHGDFDHFIAIITQPSPNALIMFRRCRIPVEMAAQAVKIDAHAFILLVVRCMVDEIRRRRADSAVKADLPPSNPFFKTGSQQKMPYPPFRFIDRVGSFFRRL